MLIVKALLPLGTLLFAFIEMAIEYRWKKKGGKKRKARIVLILLLIITTGLTIFVLYKDDKASADQQKQLLRQEGKLNEISEQLDTQKTERSRAENALNAALGRQEALEKKISNQLVEQEMLATKAEAQQAKISRQLDEVLSVARQRYPNQTDSEAISSLLRRFSQLESQSKELAKKVSATTLSLKIGEVTQSQKGPIAHLKLEPSNRMPIGEVRLQALIAKTSSSRLVSFSPSGISTNVRTKFSADRTSASLSFTPIKNDSFIILLGVSGPGRIIVSGSHGIGTVEINIEN